jgi:succinate dehydrogenase hydrophobic anchor subunit
MDTKGRSLSIFKRGLTFEAVMWAYTRLSALGMYGLILIAILGALIMGARTQMNMADVLRWGFMPNVTHVQDTGVPDLAPWSTPLWKSLASLMVLVAASHGVHGVVVILDDYIASRGGRRIVRLLSIAFIVPMIPIAVYVIWTS